MLCLWRLSMYFYSLKESDCALIFGKFRFFLPFEHEIFLTYRIHKESFRYGNSVIYFSDKGVCCYL